MLECQHCNELLPTHARTCVEHPDYDGPSDADRERDSFSREVADIAYRSSLRDAGEEIAVDPNEALARARLAALDLLDPAGNVAEQEEAADNLANAFHALDQWIAGGGFLPTAWQSPARDGCDCCEKREPCDCRIIEATVPDPETGPYQERGCLTHMRLL